MGLKTEPRLDPFGETANPADYVPRLASEAALFSLRRAIRSGRTAVLTAPPGFGKSLLLRLLARHLEPGLRCLMLPYAALDLRELCAWTLGLLAEDAGDDARSGLLRLARRQAESGSALVLLIDDGGSMPPDTARELGELIRESGNRLRVVVAAADAGIASRLQALFGREVVAVDFSRPMTAWETTAYVRSRLERSRLPQPLRDRFDETSLGRIHRDSGGVPRRVHALARALLEPMPGRRGMDWGNGLGVP